MTTTLHCVRGCTRRDRHLTDCPDTETCAGCTPRPADHGRLCRSDHLRLTQWLSGEDMVSLTWADRWLGDQLGHTRSYPTDIDRITGTAESRDWTEAVIAQRQQIGDILSQWLELMVEQMHLTGPDRHDVAGTCAYLRPWISRIEDAEWVPDLWEEFRQAMTDAHSLAPWRPEIKREKGAPCPDCNRLAVVQFGGEDLYTCRSCWQCWEPDTWDRWKRLLAFERGEVVA